MSKPVANCTRPSAASTVAMTRARRTSESSRSRLRKPSATNTATPIQPHRVMTPRIIATDSMPLIGRAAPATTAARKAAANSRATQCTGLAPRPGRTRLTRSISHTTSIRQPSTPAGVPAAPSGPMTKTDGTQTRTTR